MSDDHRRESSVPWWILLSAVTLFTARWVWVAGTGDYGWTYEQGMRIAQGEVPYCDFITTLPPLGGYTLAGLIAVFGQSLWLFGFNLYASWAVALVVGLLILRELGCTWQLRVGAVLLAASLSLPVEEVSHTYSYQATVLAGLVILFLLRWFRFPRAIWICLAGFAAGLCLFAKQNVAVMIVAAAVFVLVMANSAAGRRSQVLRCLGWFVAGWLIGAMPPFIYFAAHAGTRELVCQMFLDAGRGKGGAMGMLYQSMPRVLLTVATPSKPLVMAALTLLLLGACGFVFARAFQRGSRMNGQLDATSSLNVCSFWRWVMAYFGVAVLLSVSSLLDMPMCRELRAACTPRYLLSWTSFMMNLTYASITMMLVVYAMRRSWRSGPDSWVACVLLAALSVGHAMSNPNYISYAAPVSIPLFSYLLDRERLVRSAALFTVWAIVAVTVAYLFPSYPPTFKALATLPANSPFAGLRSSAFYCEGVEELWRDVHPRIQGARTLWLCPGGPHLAFGGRSVFNVPSLLNDTYGTRSEERLRTAWTIHPPQFVVLGAFRPAAGAQFMTQESLRKWLATDYVLVWHSPTRDLGLWQKK